MRFRYLTLAAALGIALAAMLWSASRSPRTTTVSGQPTQGEPALRKTARPVPLGDVRTDLLPKDLVAFQEGHRLFVSARPEMGPYFFGSTCAECHFKPTLGGSGDPEHSGFLGPGPGGVEPFPTYALPGWKLTPRPATASRRIVPPLFALGLVEQIPDEMIRATCRKNGGHAEPAKRLGSWPMNEVARFGYKPYLGTLTDFIGDVLRGAMGVTSEVETTSDEDDFPDPEVDRSYVETLAAFVRGLPPLPRDGTDAAGEAVFHSLGCATCHVPDMPPAHGVFSDFCLHRMGSGLADDIVDHTAQGDQFRTQPLWGLRFRNLFLHDGSAQTVEEAITAHGGDAEPAANAYRTAQAEDRAALLRFLRTL